MKFFEADYYAIGKKLDELSTVYKKISDETARIAGYCADLDIFWDGAANDAYMGRVGDDLINIGIIMLKLRETITAAQKAMDIYMENEREIQRIMSDNLRR